MKKIYPFVLFFVGVFSLPLLTFAAFLPDVDGDSVSDGVDNCLTVPNFDQLDTDANGIGDACDHVPENTLLLCSDGIDNDHNDSTDIADDSCVLFRPTIYFTKILNNNELGTKQFSDFSFHWIVGDFGDDFSAPEGTRALTFPFSGEFTVSETPVDGYTTTIGSGCSGVLNINTNSECVISNDFNRESDLEGQDENTIALCSDGLDNDNDELIDSSDPDCDSVLNVPAPVVVGGSSSFDYYGCTNQDAWNFNSLANVDDGSCVTEIISSNEGSSKSDETASDSSTEESKGEVLGESTTTPDISLPKGCGEYIHTYMRRWNGARNDVEDVKRLQEFLNETMDAHIPTIGNFGPQTMELVKKFQRKYHAEIIQPWIDAGFGGADIKNGSGYVYQTTKRWINIMKCESLHSLPMPELKPDISNKREQSQ